MPSSAQQIASGTQRTTLSEEVERRKRRSAKTRKTHSWIFHGILGIFLPLLRWILCRLGYGWECEHPPGEQSMTLLIR